MYNNRVRKINPGFLAILIDQSEAMGEQFPNGEGNLADNTAIVVNELIYNLLLEYTFIDGYNNEFIPYGCVFVLVVGYGGNNTCLICDNWLSELESYFDYENYKSFIDGIPYEIQTIKIVEPVAKGPFSLYSALLLAKKYLSMWLTERSTADDVAPLIVNVTTGCLVSEDSRIVSLVNEIMEQQIPDGNPIFYNLRLSYDNKSLVEFPHELSHCLDPHAKLLFASSSVITEDLKNRCYKFFSNREHHEGSRLFVDNITNRQSLEEMFYFIFEYFRRN